MIRQISFALCSVWMLAAAPPVQLPDDDHAFLVVTGMRVEGEAGSETRDLSVAEGAVVKVVAKGGATQERKTVPFTRGGQEYFTADFPVNLETTYEIVMSFRNGTVIRIEDYRLPRDWRTHFLFHSTTGTKSPASILRKTKDEKSSLHCYVYAVWPYSNYKALGGSQIRQPD